MSGGQVLLIGGGGGQWALYIMHYNQTYQYILPLWILDCSSMETRNTTAL